MKTFLSALLEAYTEYPVTPDLLKNPLLTGPNFRTPLSINHYELVDKLSKEVPSHPDEHAHILQYTDGSEELNSNLWTSFIGGGDIHNKHRDNLQTMNNFLLSHPTPEEDIHVFSGFKHKNSLTEQLDSAGSGHVFANIPSFTSASLNPLVANKFGSSGKILRIKIKKGQQVGGYIQPHSLLYSEEEFTLAPNHILKINATPTTILENGSAIHDAEIVNPNTPEVPRQVALDNLRFQKKLDAITKRPSLSDKLSDLSKATSYHDIAKFVVHSNNTPALASALAVHPMLTERHLLNFFHEAHHSLFRNKDAYGPRLVDKAIENGHSKPRNAWELTHNPSLSEEDVSKLHNAYKDTGILQNSGLEFHHNLTQPIADEILEDRIKNKLKTRSSNIFQKASTPIISKYLNTAAGYESKFDALGNANELYDKDIHKIVDTEANRGNLRSALISSQENPNTKDIHKKMVNYLLDNEDKFFTHGITGVYAQGGFINHFGDETIKAKLRNSKFSAFNELGKNK